MTLVPTITFLSAELIPHDAPRPVAPEVGITAEYGEYLTGSCKVCHGLTMSGGPIPGFPSSWPPALNLTFGPGSSLPSWTEEGFINTLRTWITPDGRELRGKYMPWRELFKSMKLDLHPPTAKLVWFQEKLALTADDFARLTLHRAVFLKRKEEFAEKLYAYFREIPETRIMLQDERRKDRLKKVWIQWYDLLFQGKLDESFYTRTWRSGLRHVELNIDKSLINLAYSVVRQYCQEVTRSEIPHEEHEPLLKAMDKILDFCVLVEPTPMCQPLPNATWRLSEAFHIRCEIL